MNRLALFALASTLTLAACSGHSSTSAVLPGTAEVASDVRTLPYTMPLAVNDASREIAAQASARHTETYGGVPTFNVQVLLTDAPMNFGPGGAVNLAIADVQGLSNGQAVPLISYNPDITVNMLDLTTSALDLGDYPIPQAQYQGLRVVIDVKHSSVVSGGQTYPVRFGFFIGSLFVPSMTSMANVDFLQPFNGNDGNVSFLIDFNVAQSVSISPLGFAEIGPNIIGVPWNQAAVIDGTVVNAQGRPVSNATVVAKNPDGSVAGVTMTNSSGAYEFHALAGGTYSLTVYNVYLAATGDQYISSGADSVMFTNGPSITVKAGYKAIASTIID